MTLRTMALGFAVAAVCPAGVDFEKEVQPVLEKNCVGCHNEEMRMGSLRLDTRAGALAGGRSGQGVIPGEPERSRIYEMISGDKPRMPPTGALPKETVELLKRWIAEGAVWPEKPAAGRKFAPDERMAGWRALARTGKFAEVHAAAGKDAGAARDAEGNTLLHYAALYGSAADMKRLLARGADVNAANGARATALHWSLGDVAKVRPLLDAGAAPSAQTADGRSPLRMAAGHSEGGAVVRLLLAKGAKPDRADLRVAFSACAADSAEALLDALQLDKPAEIAGVIPAWDDCPAAEAMLARRGVPPAVVREKMVLLSAGGAAVLRRHPAPQMAEQTTALLYAVYSDPVDLGLIRQLIAAGADVNAKNKDGRTALFLARRKGAADVEKLLLAAGAKE